MEKRSLLRHSILFYLTKSFPDKAADLLKQFGKILNEYIDVFRTQSNIYDETFLGKYLTTFSCLRNSFVIDAQLGSKYRSENP